MGAEFKNTQYKNHENQVSLVEDVYLSSDTAAKRLLQYDKETATDFKHRKDISILDNYVKKSVLGAADVIFRKPITHEITDPDTLEFFESVDFRKDLDTFAKEVTKSYLRDGCTFVLVDAPEIKEGEIVTKKDAKEKRPYFVNILRKNVINWEIKDNQFVYLTVEESYDASKKRFEEDFKQRQRVYNADGTIELWEEGVRIDVIETGIKKIPIVMIGDFEEPFLYDLAKIDLTHFNRLSEFNRYLRIGASPILKTWGMSEDGIKTLGIDQGFSFTDKDSGDAEWLEMSGQNFKSIQEYLGSLEQKMIDFTVNFATSAKIKTATQVDKESTSSESNLTNTAQKIQEGINRALQLRNEYLSRTADDIISVNKDYDSNILTPEQWTGYRTDYLQGIISWETLMSKLQDGEVYAKMDETELDEEKSKINEI